VTPLSDFASGSPDPDNARAATPSLQAPPRPELRILLVEDDRPTQRLGKMMLTRSGYAVDTADDGAEAWAALEASNYDLVITDNQMPQMSGMELIRRIRESHHSTPVILASGTLPTLRPEDLRTLLDVAILPKPYLCDELLSFVREVLRAASIGRPPPGARISDPDRLRGESKSAHGD
jgi:DNA-binding response OmpR family regulator